LKLKRNYSLKKQRAIAGIIFSSPFIIGLIILFVPAVISLFRFSLNDIEVLVGGNGYKMTFAGLDYYSEAVLKDAKFNRMLVESISSMLVQTPVILIFSLFAASLLNQEFKGRLFARMVFFIPVIVSTGIIAFIDNNWVSSMTVNKLGNILSDGEGLGLEVILSQLDFGKGLLDVVVSAADGLNEIIRSSGMQIFIFLAAFQEVPPSLYEAAKVEGCSAWECFWKITIPSVTPQIIICGVYTLIDVYTATDTEIYTYIEDFAFVSNQQSLASAMNVIYLLAVGVVILLAAGIIKLSGKKQERR